MVFGVLGLLSPTERSIVVETHLGNRIENSIALPPTASAVSRYQLLRSHHLNWKLRKPACGTYNCFGHLFASRRTSIRDDAAIAKILSDDGYRRLAPSETAAIGDVVLYRDRGDGELLHGGQVIGSDRVHPAGSPLPQVLSKWNDACGEDVHAIRDVPYDAQGIEFDVETWTDRPR